MSWALWQPPGDTSNLHRNLPERGISFMVPLMKALEEMVPVVQFTFRLGSVRELELLLYGRQIDYILITHRLQNPDFTYQFVCGDRLLLACPASWEDRTEVSPDGTRILLPIEKVPADRILMPGVHQSIYPFAAHFLESHGIHNTRQSPASNMEIHMQSVAAELGCCFTLASYIPTFSHIPGILFASPAVREEPVSWSLGLPVPAPGNKPPLHPQNCHPQSDRADDSVGATPASHHIQTENPPGNEYMSSRLISIHSSPGIPHFHIFQ